MLDEVLITGTRTYKVAGRSPVYLSVTIGEGQAGSSSILWQGNIIAEGAINKVPVGSDNEILQYKSLRITTKIKDVNPSTNKTSVIYKLENGSSPEEFQFQAETSESGYAVYSITFVFV